LAFKVPPEKLKLPPISATAEVLRLSVPDDTDKAAPPAGVMLTVELLNDTVPPLISILPAVRVKL
jgi:hypothetical protein